MHPCGTLAGCVTTTLIVRFVFLCFACCPARQVEFVFTSERGNGEAPWKQLAVTNDGKPFSSEDFVRVARIAEGNPDVNAVGQFGVGFYSTFSLTDSPIISSGGQCLVFSWADKRLETFCAAAPVPTWTGAPPADMAPACTSIIMQLSNPSRVWDWADIAKFIKRAMCFIANVTCVRVVVDGRQTLCSTKQYGPAKAMEVPGGCPAAAPGGLFQLVSVEARPIVFTVTTPNADGATTRSVSHGAC